MGLVRGFIRGIIKENSVVGYITEEVDDSFGRFLIGFIGKGVGVGKAVGVTYCY